MNNLRQLAAAADQFYLETGARRATYGDLVGENKYVKRVSTVDGEDYGGIQFEEGKPIQTTTRQGYVITYGP
jgi:type IV pilus assembly protein PilA